MWRGLHGLGISLGLCISSAVTVVVILSRSLQLLQRWVGRPAWGIPRFVSAGGS